MELILEFFCVFSHLFLISSAYVKSVQFLPFIVPIFAWIVLLVSLIFLKRSLVFPILLFFSMSLHWGRPSYLFLLFFGTLQSEFLRKGCEHLFFSLLPFTSLLFSAICKSSSDNRFSFLHFFFLGMVLITASCKISRSSVRSSSGTLSDIISWIYLSLPLYNRKGFDLGHTWMV